MSGHSKWATIKHKKGAADSRRAKVFAKLIRQVEVAAREGGGDPTMNPTLRTMFQKRGTGELEGVTYEQITYEGYAAGGVAVLIEVLTDNRNRTGSDVRSIFSRAGGSMAEPGAVAWQFHRKGVIIVPGTVEEDELMLAAADAGAEDIERDGDSADLAMVPENRIPLDSPSTAKQVLNLIDALEENDDVQEVYANFDIPDSILEEVSA